MYYFIGNLALSDLLAEWPTQPTCLVWGHHLQANPRPVVSARGLCLWPTLGLRVQPPGHRHWALHPYHWRWSSTMGAAGSLLPAHQCLLGHLPRPRGPAHHGLELHQHAAQLLHRYCRSTTSTISSFATVFTLLLLAIVVLYCRIYSLVKDSQPSKSWPSAIVQGQPQRWRSRWRCSRLWLLSCVFMAPAGRHSSSCSCWRGLQGEDLWHPVQNGYFLVLAVLNSGTNHIIYTLSTRRCAGPSSESCPTAVPQQRLSG